MNLSLERRISYPSRGNLQQPISKTVPKLNLAKEQHLVQRAGRLDTLSEPPPQEHCAERCSVSRILK